MAPDDPRHGTYAGYQHHKKHDHPTCQPCRDAASVYVKQMNYRNHRGHRMRIPLGVDAYHTLTTWNIVQLSKATGIRQTNLYHIRAKGPHGIVLRGTRDRILAARPAFTPIGIQRRIQALAAIGYSANAVSIEAGMSVDAIRRIRRGSPKFVRHNAGEKIVAAYDRLAMTPAPETYTKTAERQRSQAAAKKWPPPLAWVDIDDPDEIPEGVGWVPKRGRQIRTEDRLADIRVLDAADATLDEITAAFGISVNTFWKWCDRNKQLNLYARIARRTRQNDNQHTAARDQRSREAS